MRMSLILFSSCLSLVLARCDRMSIRILLVVQRHIPAPLSTPAVFPLFHSLCLNDAVFVCIHPCFTCQSSLDNCSASFRACHTFLCIVQWLSPSNFCPHTTPFLVIDKTAQQRFLESCGLQKKQTPSSPILQNHTCSPNCAMGFLHLRPVRLSSSFFPSLLLILFMTLAAKRKSQLSNGQSSAMRTLVFCSAEFRGPVE